MGSGDCPSTELLRDYVLGCLEPNHLDEVAGHLRDCESCLTSIDRMHAESDTFVAALRRPPSEPEIGGPAYEKAVADLLKESPYPQAATSRLGPGSLVREYRLLEALGEGGMGTVYRAIHLRLEREVALKVVRGNWAGDPTMVARFQREMRAAGLFNHPHLVHATDAGEVDGIHFLVMEYVPGIDLAALVRRDGPLPLADACELIRQAALGLQHAHQHGLIHRDIKPSNLRLTPDGEVKILDFGLALLREEPALKLSLTATARTEGRANSHLTSVNRVLGTNDYMAPEQWINSHNVDARADVYGLGCTLWFLLVGRPPAGGGLMATALQKYRSDAPLKLAETVSRMLAPRVVDRLSSAQEVCRALEPFCKGHRLSTLGGGTSNASGAASVTFVEGSRIPSRRKTLAVAALAACILIGGVVAYFATSRPTRTLGVLHAEVPVVIDPAAPGLSDVQTTDVPEQLPVPREWVVPEPIKSPIIPAVAAEAQRNWAVQLRRPIEQSNSFGMKFALIPPGEIALPGDYTLVISKPFEIATHETTMESFRQFVEANDYRTDVEKSGLGGIRFIYPVPKGGKSMQKNPLWIWRSPGWESSTFNHPVVHVTQRDAIAFCEWLSKKEKRMYRLPTWAEWQWANYAGAQKQQQHASLESLAVTRRLKDGKLFLQPEPVGQKLPNAWGLYDMLGNVEEWTLDFPLLSQRRPGRHIDPRYNLGNSQGTMGGSFFSLVIDEPGTQGYTDDFASDRVGFRVLREP